METHRLYDIKEAAHHLGVAPSTLRYWEQKGLVRSGRNPANDYRRYALHDLITISEIAFYRRLGVPVKELRNYRTISLDELDATLDRTQKEVEQRLAELKDMQVFLERQRALNAQAVALQRAGMQPGTPVPQRLSAIDYDDPGLWLLLIDQPWRYGVVIEADEPNLVLESLTDLPPSEETRWERAPESDRGLECLLRIDPDTDASNAPELFAHAAQHGMQPERIVASYLLTAAESEGGLRWDYYRAWVLGA
ncbi:MAG: MerR family transcriptional regulator [Gordonibacter sp.]|uniref:MerR family transcriptional regulator n=1 Tax=Gordonibacter sp. TaxID=1968902 RepID=UPI002FC8B6CC